MMPRWKVRYKHILSADDLDKVTPKLKWKELKHLHDIARGLPKNERTKHEVALLQSMIKECRSYLKDSATSLFEVSMTLGKNTFTESFSEWPDYMTLKSCLDEKLDSLRKKRKEKAPKVEKKEYMGIYYETVGGVFNKEQISKLLKDKNNNALSRIGRTKKPHAKIVQRYVGIELEFLCKTELSDLQEKMCEAKLEGYVHVGTDGSVTEPTHEHKGMEIRILCKEVDVKDVVTRVCKTIKDNGGWVNNTCGMHVHFDMRTRDYKKSYHNLVRSLPLLISLVPSTRTDKWGQQYCKINTDANFDTSMSGGRYQAINASSYNRHQTIEVRLHSGTLNPSKICNWINAILPVVDSESKIDKDIKTVANYTELFETQTKLIEYMTQRVETFKKTVSTEEDEKNNNNYEMAV